MERADGILARARNDFLAKPTMPDVPDLNVPVGTANSKAMYIRGKTKCGDGLRHVFYEATSVQSNVPSYRRGERLS